MKKLILMTLLSGFLILATCYTSYERVKYTHTIFKSGAHDSVNYVIKIYSKKDTILIDTIRSRNKHKYKNK